MTVSDTMMMLRGICLATGAALHVAPIPTMREIRAHKSTLNFHVAPYASTLLNHTINGYYAIIRQDPALMLHRTLGIIANTYYVYTYMTYVPPTKLSDTTAFLKKVLMIFLGFMTELHVLLPLLGLQSQFFSHIAFFAALTGIGLAASPLATVVSFACITTPSLFRTLTQHLLQKEVIRNKDSSSLPYGLCLMVTIQCTSWTIYGYLVRDWSTFANNIVGVVLGSIQLLLIFIFPNRRALRKTDEKPHGAAAVDDSADAIEAGKADTSDE